MFLNPTLHEKSSKEEVKWLTIYANNYLNIVRNTSAVK